MYSEFSFSDRLLFVLGGAIRTKQWASSHHHDQLRARKSMDVHNNPKEGNASIHEDRHDSSSTYLGTNITRRLEYFAQISLHIVLRYCNSESDSKWYCTLAAGH
jgi:hypothetical protein